MNRIIIILLGSHLELIRNNRILSALTFVNSYDKIPIKWFLTGGIKNDGLVSEADIMYNEINTYNVDKTNNWTYIIDRGSRNTVENFYNLNNYLNDNYYEKIYVATSKFHYRRANRISNLLLKNETVEWILGDFEYNYSLSDENIFYNNIESDINKINSNITSVFQFI